MLAALPTACLRRIARHVRDDAVLSQGLGRVNKLLHALFGSDRPPENCTFWRRRARRYEPCLFLQPRSEREAFLQLCGVVYAELAVPVEDVEDDNTSCSDRGVIVCMRFASYREFVEVSEMGYDSACGVINDYLHAHVAPLGRVVIADEVETYRAPCARPDSFIEYRWS